MGICPLTFRTSASPRCLDISLPQVVGDSGKKAKMQTSVSPVPLQCDFSLGGTDRESNALCGWHLRASGFGRLWCLQLPVPACSSSQEITGDITCRREDRRGWAQTQSTELQTWASDAKCASVTPCHIRRSAIILKTAFFLWNKGEFGGLKESEFYSELLHCVGVQPGDSTPENWAGLLG